MAKNFPHWEESACCHKKRNKFPRQTDVVSVLYDMDLTWSHSVERGRFLLKDDISHTGNIDIWPRCAR
jgi:hypothetical protein